MLRDPSSGNFDPEHNALMPIYSKARRLYEGRKVDWKIAKSSRINYLFPIRRLAVKPFSAPLTSNVFIFQEASETSQWVFMGEK